MKLQIAALAAGALLAMGSGVGVAAADPITDLFNTGSAGSSSQPAPPQVGQWSGTWRVNGISYPSTLFVTQSVPLQARLSTPSRPCFSNWNQVGGNGGNLVVRATVTAGNCISNTWNLNTTATTMSAIDGGASINLTKS